MANCRFSFRGRIENGLFEGPGKFKFDDGKGAGAAEDGVCIDAKLLMARPIANITGRFEKGRVEVTN